MPGKGLRQKMERWFEDFERVGSGGMIFSMEPLWRHEATRSAAPAVDVPETKAHELTAELPDPTEKDIEARLINDGLTIRGEGEGVKRHGLLHFQAPLWQVRAQLLMAGGSPVPTS